MNRSSLLAALATAAAPTAACSSSDDAPSPAIDATVGAAGGTFTGGPVTVQVPAGALAGNARLTVTAAPPGPALTGGVPNQAMDAGAILSLTRFATAAGASTVQLLQSWGPNRFDVRALPDNPLDDGANNPTDAPPIWNYLDLEAQGYGFGWDGLFKGNNALASQAEAVYDLVMHGTGAFGTASGTLPR